MATPSKGSVVLIPFPFSDLSKSKLRPSVVLAPSGKEEWILCQITSKQYIDQKAVELSNQDFQTGSLRVTSFVRPGKLFTANNSLIISEVGKLKGNVLNLIITSVIEILKAG
ncbi:MAG TPA: type II toxin-antitoxin system PemK/MazF family toxin [Candidatus Brocadiaceae bacterium]|nr:type II toxin-antitoxin system PemK/MazF family toxin [Candidatus Brocadiaceae bacterium]